jgi:hypothetical protein
MYALYRRAKVFTVVYDYQDNTSSIITLANKDRSDSKRTTHVAVRYFFIKNYIERSEIAIKYLPTNQMLADILTKPLQGDLFEKLRLIIFSEDNSQAPKK